MVFFAPNGACFMGLRFCLKASTDHNQRVARWWAPKGKSGSDMRNLHTAGLASVVHPFYLRIIRVSRGAIHDSLRLLIASQTKRNFLPPRV